jgi:ornithine cyclodeaminase/alanine dehydrogenase-like protein (mu-crystallin family)
MRLPIAALVNKLGESGASGLQADSHGKGGVKSAALVAAQACSKAQVEACMKVRHQSDMYIYIYTEREDMREICAMNMEAKLMWSEGL